MTKVSIHYSQTTWLLITASEALQTLGCIPRAPTPPPEPTLLPEQYERALRLQKRKEREKDRKVALLEVCFLPFLPPTPLPANHIQAEMEEMKRKMSLLLPARTAEATDSPNESTIFTPTTSSSEIHDTTELIRDLQEITNPNPKPKPEEIIDLTGDSDSD